MNIAKKIYCRIFQGAFRIAMPFMPYREPVCLDSLAKIPEMLSEKKVGIFICCGFPERCDEYFQKSFPTYLRSVVFAEGCFGGEIRPDREKGISRLIAKSMVRGIINNNRDPDKEYIPMPAILPENIARFSDIVKANCIK